MSRQRTVKEECANRLSGRIGAETVLVPLDTLPYTNYEGVLAGGLPIETPSQGLSPEYAVYAMAPNGYRAYFYSEYGLDQFKVEHPEMVKM